jgi:hypothetical protein
LLSRRKDRHATDEATGNNKDQIVSWRSQNRLPYS